MEKIKTIFIVGPTASGKTSLGVDIAEYAGGEVVSADSMQIYKYLSIATAKPTASQMRSVPHHMIDLIEPDKSYSVAGYKEDAMKCILDISSRGKIPVVVGGTGLYVDTLLYNTVFFDTGTDEKLRERLYKKSEKDGCEKLWEQLNSIDPLAAANIHKNNVKKIIRALEIYYLTGKTLTDQNAASRSKESILDSVIIGLNVKDRNFLYDRINKRVDLMISQGLVDEAREYFERYGIGTASQAIGCKELLPYFSGERSIEECIENLKMQTRRFAKRQLTWFRRNENINWLYIDEYRGGELNDAVKNILKERGIV